tara:strand:- start:515 stop:814 length:300 start_codon:yes stop_codon:yes gene_type:complete
MGLENFITKNIERFSSCSSHSKEEDLKEENFTSKYASNVNASPSVLFLLDLITVVVVLIVVALLGAYLWNHSVYVLIKGVNRSSWINVLALSLLIKIIM